ncbi:MAG: zinc dependent phospholipase C family protein [Actinomycetota bacterium]
MPGHFTHIYTARRVSDLLLTGEFTDWPDVGEGGGAVSHYDPQYCGRIMHKWQKFTAVGAIGPDIFFFSEDWNTDLVGPHSDQIMLALATYYYFDSAAENDWEPLLIILEEVSTTMAAIIRFLIKLQKAWDDFVEAWNKTIGPLVDAASEILDDLTGGLISQFQVALGELKLAIIQIGEQEITTFADMWGLMNTVVHKGWSEDSFLWSDMLHYRRTSAICQALVRQAEALRDDSESGGDRFEQFLAFALGYIVHVGTDTIAHSFVNEQCGGPYRDHPTRHHLLENHIDAWNYVQSGEGGTIPTDPWGKTADYPDLSMSALWFLVQMTPDNPHGEQRPSPLSEDPDERKEQLDVDGEMPLWMAEAIVAALKETFEGHPHPKIYQGDAFQQTIDQGMLTTVVKDVTGHGLDRPFQEILDGIAPPPPFSVPKGFPLPWEVQTAYRLMISLYKLNFNGSWELQKPRVPDFVIVPPASDFTNLFQPPDFSGINFDNPIEDVCDVFIALVEWIIKEIADAIKLAGDLIKMAVSPFTYGLRMGLYELAMKIWDVAMKTHDVMAHTGILMPHSEQRYDDGELRLPNEIDLPMITLGGTVDGAFQQALADAIDPLGHLDGDLGVVVSHSVRDPHYPYYPVLLTHADGRPAEDYEYHRPWAYPSISEHEDAGVSSHVPTPTETYDPSKSDPAGPQGAFRPMRPGPYPEGSRPDEVFFRTSAGFDAEARQRYESAQTPWQTDLINEETIGKARVRRSPLGDPVPFSAYLIGQLANPTGYDTQFNLDADRAYAYLTWDWNRGNKIGTAGMGIKYPKPIVPPQGDDGADGDPGWDGGGAPMQLHYVDPPAPPVIILDRGPGSHRRAEPSDADLDGAGGES